MKGNNNYIKNIIYEEPSSQEISNTNPIVITKKNSMEKIVIPSTNNNDIQKQKSIKNLTNNDLNLDNIYLNEETSFLKKGILNNSSYENNEISLSEIDNGDILNGNTTINYKQAYQYFCNIDYSLEKKKIVVEDFKEEKCCKKFFVCDCSNKLKLNSNLTKERERIFCIAKIIYNDNKEIHYYILTTIYRFLTGENNCNKKGKHWEKIGFQDKDPINDLRSVGMFGPLQILYLKDLYSNFLKNLFSYLLKYNCEWLFIGSLLNLTKITLDCLRNGTLIPICNRKESVIDVVNDFFCGLVYKFYLLLEIPEEQKLTAEFISIQIDNLKKLGNKTPNLILSKKNVLDKYNYS